MDTQEAALAVFWAVSMVGALGVLAGFEVGHRLRRRGFSFGLLTRAGSCWVGAHWSSYNRRICINPVPCVTVWVALPGGKTP